MYFVAEGEDDATVMARIMDMADEGKQAKRAELIRLQNVMYAQNKDIALAVFAHLQQSKSLI